ncbi:MAG: ubiquinone/menaquinone biosynthesis methyltransferase [Pseudomonadota bacterium]
MTKDRVPADGSGAMFDAIAPRYDLLNRVLSLGIDRSWRRRAVRQLACVDGGLYLDLACGTADVALTLLATQDRARVVGLDPSLGMLRQAARKGLPVDSATLLLGAAAGENLPLRDASVHGAIMAFGIRNAVDRLACLRELGRVVRPGGRVVVLELGEPRGPSGVLYRAYFRGVAPVLGGLLSRGTAYRYLTQSVAAFPEPEAFAALLRQAGLQLLGVERLTLGAAHIYTAQRP